MGKVVNANKYKSFEQWYSQEVEEEFGLTRLYDGLLIDALFADLPAMTAKENERTTELSEKYAQMMDAWNEYDLSIAFIGPLLDILNMHNPTYRTFFNHTLSAKLNGKAITGRVDCLLAKGREFPKSPIFFLQEFKPEGVRNIGNPLGQLLIEMIAAQSLNPEDKDLLYGCYIIGRNWFFVVLDGKQYSVSNALNASDEDIFKIIKTLKKIKLLFEAKINYQV